MCLPSPIHFLSEAQSTNPPRLSSQENFHLKSKHLLGGKQTLGSWAPTPLPHSLALSLAEAPEDLRSIAHNNLMAWPRASVVTGSWLDPEAWESLRPLVSSKGRNRMNGAPWRESEHKQGDWEIRRD